MALYDKHIPRPLCVSCGKPWVPPEGIDAGVVACCKPAAAQGERHQWGEGDRLTDDVYCLKCGALLNPYYPSACKGPADPEQPSAKERGERHANLMNALADRVEQLSDDELFADAVAAGFDVAAEAERIRQRLLRAVKQEGKHRCKLCGCLWRLNPPSEVQPGGAWSLWDGEQRPGPCCNNVAMGEQIEPVKEPKERGEAGEVDRPQWPTMTEYPDLEDRLLEGVARYEAAYVAANVRVTALQSTLAERDRLHAERIDTVATLNERAVSAEWRLADRDREVERLGAEKRKLDQDYGRALATLNHQRIEAEQRVRGLEGALAKETERLETARELMRHHAARAEKAEAERDELNGARMRAQRVAVDERQQRIRLWHAKRDLTVELASERQQRADREAGVQEMRAGYEQRIAAMQAEADGLRARVEAAGKLSAKWRWDWLKCKNSETVWDCCARMLEAALAEPINPSEPGKGETKT